MVVKEAPLAASYYLKGTESLATSGTGLTLGTAGSGDYFANFPGANLKLISGDDQWDLSGTNSFLAIKMSGSSRGKILRYTYTGVSADFSQLTGVAQVATNFTNAGISNTASTVAFGAGDLVVPCDAGGCPTTYGIMMAKNALYYAKGAIDAEQIFHYDDFANSGNQAHLNSIGIQGIRGWRAYEDTDGRIPGLQLIEMVRQIPILNPA